MSSFTKDVKNAHFYTPCTMSIVLLLSSIVDLTHLVSQWEYRWTSESDTWQRCHYLSTHIIRCYYLISPIFFSVDTFSFFVSNFFDRKLFISFFVYDILWANCQKSDKVIFSFWNTDHFQLVEARIDGTISSNQFKHFIV